jgi:chaperonin GroEL
MNPNKYTQVKFGKDAIDSLYEGVKEVTEAVATTLGPMGKNVLIDKGYQITILHDGVSVAESINPEEPFKNKGAKVIQEAAKKQRDECGDGTTAVMVLTQAILDKTLEATAGGVNPMSLRKGLESGAEKVINKIKELSTPVKTLEQKIQIGTISAEDPKLGKLIAETIHEIGNDGVFTVEESKAPETFVEKQKGMQIDKPYAKYFMITDSERQIAVVEDTPILVTDMPLNVLGELAGFFDKEIFQNTKKCVFIAPDFSEEFLNMLIGAKMSGQFLGLAIRAPGVSMNQIDILQDICALTGATFITKESGTKFNDCTFSMLGKAEKVQSNKWSTIIIGGGGYKDDVLQRIQVIKAQMEDTTISDFDKEQLKARLAKLTNGVAVVKVGGTSEIEMKERKERAIDAVASIQSSVKTGLVSGGEIIYLKTLGELDESILGEKILKQALIEPFKRLTSNAGYDAGEKLAELKLQPDGFGFDVLDGQFKDMIKAGIVDATAIPISAVATAVSVGVALSSLGAAVCIMNPNEK